MNPKVDDFLTRITKWNKELALLRRLLLDCQLTEELKWGVPCYVFNNGNIALIHGFKDYCAILFFKGALLSDTENILIQQTENVQSARQIRFTSSDEILAQLPTLKAYIYEAIEVEKAGIKVELKKSVNLEYTEELQQKLTALPELKLAFEALTPGRQRAYNLYFANAKQAATRVQRIEKCIPKIISGKGLNDCTCGLSKRMPNCDGSHKYIVTT